MGVARAGSIGRSFRGAVGGRGHSGGAAQRAGGGHARQHRRAGHDHARGQRHGVAPAAGLATPAAVRPSPAISAAAPSAAPLVALASTPAPQESGFLRVVVHPYADVSVDARPVGTSPPLPPLKLTAGTHTIELSHPTFKPLLKTVTVRAGETTRVEVTLGQEAVPR